MNKIIKLFATALGAGYSPIAPGTFGTLVGAVLFMGLSGIATVHYFLFLIVFIIFSSWIADRAQILFGKKDPPQVAIDEVAGLLVTMAAHQHQMDWKILVAGFIFFRFFDILKPFPIKFIEKRLSNGFGVVLDDVMAGVYANVCLFILTRFL